MDKHKDKKIAVIGFGMEGKDAFKFFLQKDINVDVFDKNKKEDLDLSDLESKELNLITGDNYLSGGLAKYDLVVRSAGVRPDLPEIKKALDLGIEVKTTTGLFFENFSGKIIGVTGTKGKGTTCTLIYEFLKRSGVKVGLAGNIGIPVLGILKEDLEWAVLEMSSFQLMDITYSPHIAVVLNITLDHMDWHLDKDEYLDAKKNIVSFQKAEDIAVLNYDYASSKSFSDHTKANIFYISSKQKVTGGYVKNEDMFININNLKKVCSVNDLMLRGKHNWENVTAAYTAACLAGADLNAVRSVIGSFKGLEHRLEFVREVGGVKYYNDSFSTNIDTTKAAVISFTEDITLILGGYDKELDYQRLVENTTNLPNLKNIILIGDMGKKYYEWYQQSGFKGKLVMMGYSKMNKIVENAKGITKEGGVVLLSPSTSSFDMFENYKKRGDEFKQVVNKL